MNLTKRIIQSCNSNDDDKKLNIFMLHSNERYESYLAETGHNFFCPTLENSKWEKEISERPENVYMLGPQCVNYQYLAALNFDIIIAQNRNQHWSVANQISNLLQIPTILIERYPPPSSKEYNEQVEAIKKISADINVFDNIKCQKMWGFVNSTCIEDPIPRDVFKPDNSVEKENDLLTVIHNHDEDPRVNAIWDFMKQEFPSIKCFGNFKNISNPCNSAEDLAREYNNSKIYINTNVSSSAALREAMLCGCAVIGMNDDLNDIIEDGVNGYLCMDLLEMKQKTEILLENPDIAKDMGQKAIESMQNRCTVDIFKKAWNDIFNTIQKGITQ